MIQTLLFWQGGFLFYAAVVVPIGTDVHGSFGQGMVTRHVTNWMNVSGVVAVVICAWDQRANRETRRLRTARWALWAIMTGGLVALALLHPQVEGYVDFAGGRIDEYQVFYQWHRVYLYVASAQWVAGVAYVIVMLRAWAAKSPTA